MMKTRTNGLGSAAILEGREAGGLSFKRSKRRNRSYTDFLEIPGDRNLCFRCVGNRIHVPIYSRRIYREMISCNEGVLEWIKKEDLLKLNLWEGDKIFLKLLQENAPFFSLKLVYKGDELTEAVLNGENLKKS